MLWQGHGWTRGAPLAMAFAIASGLRRSGTVLPIVAEVPDLRPGE